MDYMILSFSRSGTKILNYFLSQQDDVECFGELFNPNKNLYTYRPINKILEKIINEINTIYHNYDTLGLNEFRMHNPEILLNLIKKYSTKKFNGLKFLFWQLFLINENFDLVDFAIKNKTKIILLHRENIFLHYLSFMKASSSGIYTLTKKSPERKDNIKIKLNPKFYLNFKKQKTKMFEYYENLFNSNNIPYFKTSYEKITQENAEQEKKQIYQFITGTADDPKSINCIYIKQNIYTLENQLENFEEISSRLKDDPYFIAALERDIKKQKDSINIKV